VFQIKFALLLLAVIVTVALYRLVLREPHLPSAARPHQWLGKGLAFLSLLLWIGVVLAGRWIAYVEYLFWQGEV
jgi:DNA-binding transcriptional regulator PaaX